MRIEPEKLKEDIFKDLTPLQNQSRRVAIVFAFVGVFIWFFKLVF